MSPLEGRGRSGQPPNGLILRPADVWEPTLLQLHTHSPGGTEPPRDWDSKKCRLICTHQDPPDLEWLPKEASLLGGECAHNQQLPSCPIIFSD